MKILFVFFILSTSTILNARELDQTSLRLRERFPMSILSGVDPDTSADCYVKIRHEKDQSDGNAREFHFDLAILDAELTIKSSYRYISSNSWGCTRIKADEENYYSIKNEMGSTGAPCFTKPGRFKPSHPGAFEFYKKEKALLFVALTEDYEVLNKCLIKI
jgi:hypothetical protein